MTQNRAYVLGKILSKSFQLGRTSLVDPVPELWNEDSVDSRIETMKAHFEEILEKLAKEYETLSKEPMTPELETKILNAMQQGFEALIESQPGYRESLKVEEYADRNSNRIRGEVSAEMREETKKIEKVADKTNPRGSRESRAEIEKETKKVFDALIEKRHADLIGSHKGIWIEENEAMTFVKGVFDTLRTDHTAA
ncbi:MAG: hypothetical protein ACYCTV_05420 [Leptospirales bacterium]